MPLNRIDNDKPFDEEKEEKFINKMNALDLELSQTKRLFNFPK